MKSTERILHEKQYAGRILEITQDTLFFIHKDGICLDFKPNTPDFYIKEEEVMHKDIFSFFPADTAGEMREECRKVLAHGQPSAKNYMLAKDKEVKYFKCIINRFDDEHLILQYRDITGRSVVRMNLEKNRKELREVEKAANIGLWSFDSGTRLFTYSGYTGVLCYGEEVKTASLEEYVSYIHPQDRKAFGEWVEDLVEGRKGRGFLEYRMTPGQQVNNMRVLAYNIEAYDGRTIVEGYIQNLTDIVQGRAELELITSAINHASEDIFAVTKDDRLYFGNLSYKLHHGVPAEEDIRGKSALDIALRVCCRERLEEYQKLKEKSHFIVEKPYPAFPGLLAYEYSIYRMKDLTGQEIIWFFGRDISERIKNEQKQIKAKEKAEHSNQLKSAFLANMSHEIRTPLNAIMGFSRIIAETEDKEERMQYYDIVERNNMRVQELINEILDLSKLESGMMEFNYAPVNLYTLCEDVESTYRFRCQDGVELEFEPAEDPSMYILTDRNRLFQVFSNLVGNATKFTRKGSIRFGYRREGDRIHFHVTDTGIGIAPDKIAKIFDRFIMANDHTPGTGLGLSISKIIVEKLGGSIGVSSQMGQGTTFTFSIPYTSADGKKEDDYHAARHPDADENVTHKDITILVVEDNRSSYELVEAMIGKTYRLVHANDGMEAITYYERYRPDLILMDIRMPNIDGLDATRAIREMSAEVPIITVSAYAYEEDKKAARESGSNEFLTKPITAENLKETINKYLKNKRTWEN